MYFIMVILYFTAMAATADTKILKIIYFNPASLLHPIDEGARVL